MDILKVLFSFSFQYIATLSLTIFVDGDFFFSYIGNLVVLTPYYLISRILLEGKVPQM